MTYNKRFRSVRIAIRLASIVFFLSCLLTPFYVWAFCVGVALFVLIGYIHDSFFVPSHEEVRNRVIAQGYYGPPGGLDREVRWRRGNHMFWIYFARPPE